MRHTITSILAVCWLCLLLSGPAIGADAETTTGPEAAGSAEPSESKETPESELSAEQKTSLFQFYTWSASLPKEVMTLRTALGIDQHLVLAEKNLPILTADIRDLQWDAVTAKSTPYLRKIQTDKLKRKFIHLAAEANQLEKSLADNVAQLSVKRNEWLVNQEKLTSFAAQTDLAQILALDKRDELQQSIDEALHFIDSQLQPAILMGKDLAALQVRLQSIAGDLRYLDQKYLDSRFNRSSPTMLSREFYQQITLDLVRETAANAKTFVTTHQEIVRKNFRLVIIGSLMFILLCSTIHLSKSQVKPSSRWYPFSCSPIATATFMSVAVSGIFTTRIIIDFQNQWNLIINILMMLAVIRLVRKNIDEKWKRLVFTRLALYMVFIMLLATLEFPQILMVLFAFGASLVAFLVYLLQLRNKNTNSLQSMLRKTWGILPAIVIIASMAGYEQFAIFFFSTLIFSVSIFLVVWMLFHLVCGLIQLLLKLVPLSLIQDNLSVIVGSIQPFIAVFHVLLLLAAQSVIWDIYPSTAEALADINSFGFDLAGLHISPGFLMTIFFVLYGATLFSRAVQALLLTEVLPRYKAEKGVQLSITRLVHYAIVTIGFFVMLKVLGFQLQQLTILGGALGVGIGFGLQAIVNNFVSGLILLFERPIKVGDTIQVATELGEVKKMGLRATIIQTFDNSEIVIPNSDLVTGQVTNWTLAERKVRVRIAVGVAYGTDVAKVLEILRNCAETHPMVLNKPQPVALFLAFGASSLDFELRFWIPEYLDKMTATSELNQSIESEFALQNIEIPFQQTDLHIRSVSSAAARVFAGTSTKDGGDGTTSCPTPKAAEAETTPDRPADET